jgi:hypothetical protein
MAHLNSTTISTLTALFTTTILASRRLPALLSLNTARLTSSFAILRSYLQRWDVEFIPPTAGLYVFAKLGKQMMTEEEEDGMVRRLKGKGFKMGGLGAGWVRITFSAPEGVLVEGLRRVERELFGGGVVNGESKLNGVKKVNRGTKRKLSEVAGEMNGGIKRKVSEVAAEMNESGRRKMVK